MHTSKCNERAFFIKLPQQNHLFTFIYFIRLQLIDIELRRSNGKIKASVFDTGGGISDDDLQHIFDRFYRGQKNRIRDKGGSGLGLTIA